MCFEGLLVSKSAADAVKVMPLPVSADGVIVVVVTLSGISAGRFVPVEKSIGVKVQAVCPVRESFRGAYLG